MCYERCGIFFLTYQLLMVFFRNLMKINFKKLLNVVHISFQKDDSI